MAAGTRLDRVDPTAVVAPERLTRGMMQLMPGTFSASERLLYGPGWLGAVLQRWEAASAWWSDHVVRFDYTSQLDLLARFGIRSPDTRYLAWGFAAALGAWLLFLAWHFGRGRRAHDPMRSRAPTGGCVASSHASLRHAPQSGPRAYGETVLAQRPDLRTPLEALLARYVQLRYGTAVAADAEVAEFAHAVARWRVPAAPCELSARLEADTCVRAVAEGFGRTAAAAAQSGRADPRHHPPGTADDLQIPAHANGPSGPRGRRRAARRAPAACRSVRWVAARGTEADLVVRTVAEGLVREAPQRHNVARKGARSPSMTSAPRKA